MVVPTNMTWSAGMPVVVRDSAAVGALIAPVSVCTSFPDAVWSLKLMEPALSAALTPWLKSCEAERAGARWGRCGGEPEAGQAEGGCQHRADDLRSDHGGTLAVVISNKSAGRALRDALVNGG
jgi:hypothetical protein